VPRGVSTRASNIVKHPELIVARIVQLARRPAAKT
jgi:hypothetical protein